MLQVLRDEHTTKRIAVNNKYVTASLLFESILASIGSITLHGNVGINLNDSIAQTFVSSAGSGFYTVPPGVFSICTSPSNFAGDGGGQGGYSSKTINTTPGTVISYSIGTGGIGGTSSGGGAGTNGGDTTCSTLGMTANGGSGGNTGVGGNGGGASGGTTNTTGQNGSIGGASIGGNGGGGTLGTSTGNGNNGTNGTGGSGGGIHSDGGNGGDGQVIFTYSINSVSYRGFVTHYGNSGINNELILIPRIARNVVGNALFNQELNISLRPIITHGGTAIFDNELILNTLPSVLSYNTFASFSDLQLLSNLITIIYPAQVHNLQLYISNIKNIDLKIS